MTKDETLAFTLDTLQSLREMIVFRMPKPGEYERQVLARLSLVTAMIKDQLENNNSVETKLKEKNGGTRLYTAGIRPARPPLRTPK